MLFAVIADLPVLASELDNSAQSPSPKLCESMHSLLRLGSQWRRRCPPDDRGGGGLGLKGVLCLLEQHLRFSSVPALACLTSSDFDRAFLSLYRSGDAFNALYERLELGGFSEAAFGQFAARLDGVLRQQRAEANFLLSDTVLLYVQDQQSKGTLSKASVAFLKVAVHALRRHPDLETLRDTTKTGDGGSDGPVIEREVGPPLMSEPVQSQAVLAALALTDAFAEFDLAGDEELLLANVLHLSQEWKAVSPCADLLSMSQEMVVQRLLPAATFEILELLVLQDACTVRAAWSLFLEHVQDGDAGTHPSPSKARPLSSPSPFPLPSEVTGLAARHKAAMELWDTVAHIVVKAARSMDQPTPTPTPMLLRVDGQHSFFAALSGATNLPPPFLHTWLSSFQSFVVSLSQRGVFSNTEHLILQWAIVHGSPPLESAFLAYSDTLTNQRLLTGQDRLPLSPASSARAFDPSNSAQVFAEAEFVDTCRHVLALWYRRAPQAPLFQTLAEAGQRRLLASNEKEFLEVLLLSPRKKSTVHALIQDSLSSTYQLCSVARIPFSLVPPSNSSFVRCDVDTALAIEALSQAGCVIDRLLDSRLVSSCQSVMLWGETLIRSLRRGYDISHVPAEAVHSIAASLPLPRSDFMYLLVMVLQNDVVLYSALAEYFAAKHNNYGDHAHAHASTAASFDPFCSTSVFLAAEELLDTLVRLSQRWRTSGTLGEKTLLSTIETAADENFVSEEERDTLDVLVLTQDPRLLEAQVAYESQLLSWSELVETLKLAAEEEVMAWVDGLWKHIKKYVKNISSLEGEMPVSSAGLQHLLRLLEEKNEVLLAAFGMCLFFFFGSI